MTRTQKRPKKKLWSLLRFAIFLAFLVMLSVFTLNRLIYTEEKQEEEEVPVLQGLITIISLDAETELPIKEAEFRISDLATGELVALITTDEEGRGISQAFDYNTSYRIEQVYISNPYKLNSEPLTIEISQENHELIFKNRFFDFVKEAQRLEDGTVRITNLYLPVSIQLQNPELPNGCEVTSLTAILNYYGYNISKTEMADVYLPKEPFFRKGNILFGANPFKAFAGNPREESGFFVYAPPIVEAANKYLSMISSNKTAYNVSNSTREELIATLNKGIPIIAWATLDLSEPKLIYSWYLAENNEEFIAPVNLHAVVLKGYDGNNVYIMDPLKGDITRNADEFFRSYYSLGSHAVIVKEN